MSVQNLRNKFSQNGGTVPYSPPGLSYGQPAARKQLQPHALNGNGKLNNVAGYGSGAGQLNGGTGRFKTIREEPDGAQLQPHDEKPSSAATKNHSFLQSYLANEITRNAAAPPAAVNGCGAAPELRPKSASAARPSPCRLPGKPLPRAPPPEPSTPPAGRPIPTPAAAAAANPPKFGILDGRSPSAAKSAGAVRTPPPVLGGNGPTAAAPGDDRWRTKYDEADTKRKTLLTQSQKLLREKSDMERQMAKLRSDLEASNKALSERTNQLSQLRTLSEAMYKEYDQLKKQYELETGTLHKAMERASQWYKQNRELKRRSSALMQKVMSVAPSTLDDLADDTDGNENDTEMDELRKTVKELTQEVSKLQAELNEIKLQEFEAQEQTVDLTSELDKERTARIRSEQELKEFKMKFGNLENVSRKVVEETTELHQRYKKEKEEGVKIRNDANKVKSERDVLARQSQLLMMDAASDEKIMKLLFEVEQLQRSLSQERQEHAEQLKDLQDKLESQSESEQIELYEEKLKLVEAELLCSQQRAEIAESQLDELQSKHTIVPHCVVPPPPPPPMLIPPPPPPPMTLTPNMKTIKLKTVSTLNQTNSDANAIEEIGNYLGLSSANTKGPQVQNGAIDAIINQIKGGRFSLKATDKEKQTPVKSQEPPPVVNEMMNVLGTLRRHPKRRASFKTAPADVAL